IWPFTSSLRTLNRLDVPYDMWSSSPLNGPHASLVTHTCPPLELSTFLGIQQIGRGCSDGSGFPFADLSGRCAPSTTPLKLPGFTQWIGQTGTQVPSLSPLVTSPLGPTPMPLLARKPVVNTSSFEPSGETLRMHPWWR